MKIFLIHNFYGSSSPSGENQVFLAERDLVEKNGHEVTEFLRYSDEIRGKGTLGKVLGAFSAPWNPFSASAIRRKVAGEEPDVVHVHNTFPLISPSIFQAVGRNAAKVLTLHNYRLYCPAAIPMRNGQACTECPEKRSVLPALRYGCYRQSRLATLSLAVSVALHRFLGTWEKQVDAFIALTEFQKDLMVRAGLPEERVHVKPNFYAGDPSVVPWEKRKHNVLFVGRLTAEKGVISLVRAWSNWGTAAPELLVVGEGNLRGEMQKLAKDAVNVSVHFTGQLESAKAKEKIANAKLLVLPSECFEGFPMTVAEAFAFGTPVATSNIGGLPSIVKEGVNGILFEPGDSGSLLAEVRKAWETPGVLQELGQGARKSFETLYTEEANYKTLMEIYGKAIEWNRSRKKGS